MCFSNINDFINNTTIDKKIQHMKNISADYLKFLVLISHGIDTRAVVIAHFPLYAWLINSSVTILSGRLDPNINTNATIGPIFCKNYFSICWYLKVVCKNICNNTT